LNTSALGAVTAGLEGLPLMRQQFDTSPLRRL